MKSNFRQISILKKVSFDSLFPFLLFPFFLLFCFKTHPLKIHPHHSFAKYRHTDRFLGAFSSFSLINKLHATSLRFTISINYQIIKSIIRITLEYWYTSRHPAFLTTLIPPFSLPYFTFVRSLFFYLFLFPFLWQYTQSLFFPSFAHSHSHVLANTHFTSLTKKNSIQPRESRSFFVSLFHYQLFSFVVFVAFL